MFTIIFSNEIKVKHCNSWYKNSENENRQIHTWSTVPKGVIYIFKI